MISIALPKVAFSKPARVCPIEREICSVASPSNWEGIQVSPEKSGTKSYCTDLGKGNDCNETKSEAQGCVPLQIVSGDGYWR